MSNSGYRGRSFGPRGAHTNGPANGYNGPRFPHPNFNLPRRPHRLPGPEKWIERPSFGQWQQNNNFLLHPQYRSNIQFRPNGRGRAGGGHGLLRFSGPGRPPAPQFCMGYKRNLLPRGPLPQEELIEGKTTLSPQPPLLGSEEERLQKISETANKLKEKLSSITEEELTNFWEDDLSILSNNGCEQGNIQKKSIPELSHEPPELDLTFTDFRDIGRVDCNNSKSDNVDNESSDEISIIFVEKPVDKDKKSNNEVVADNENKGECSITLDLENDKDNFDRSNISLENERYSDQTRHELSDIKCTVENSNSQNDKAKESLIFSNASESESSSKNLNENATDSAPIDIANKLTAEKSLDVNDAREISISKLATNNLDFSGNQNAVQINVPNEDKNISLHDSINVHHDIHTDTKKLECKEIQDDTQATSSPGTACQNAADVCESPKSGEINILHSNEKILPSIVCDTTLATLSTGNEVHKFNDDNNLSKPSNFQPRSFTTSPRFYLRIAGPKNHWTFSQNGKNLFFRGAQRLPFHGNRTSSPRHVAPFPVDFDPRAPPPFTLSELPPAFDPTEPPPNIRPITEPSNRQEKIHAICSLDPRNQAANSSQSNMTVVQSPLAFDPRGPPPRILNKTVSPDEKLPEFNPQQPPPKIHKREQTLQPPPIFDPRLSSQERSNLIAPLNSSRPNLIPINLMESCPTQQVADYSIGLVAPNFSQLPPISIPPHQTFISNVQMNFQPTLSQTNSCQDMMKEFALPPPSVNINEAPPFPPKVSLAEENPNLNPNISMDDGLEDMQEAMEFAKQIMNMSEETKNENSSPVFSTVPLVPLRIPVPIENASHCSLTETENIHAVKKQKKREGKVKQSKKDICKPDLIVEKQGAIEIVDKGQSVQSQTKNSEDTLLSSDQIRPKVVFNLNSKAKKIHKLEEWHRTPISVPESRDNSHQSISHTCSKEKIQSKKHSSESKRSSENQNKNKQTEDSIKKTSSHSSSVINLPVEKESNDKLYQKDNKTNAENLHSPSKVVSSNTNVQKKQKVNSDDRKSTSCTLETSWKNKVINRFLKMSKNDICNMVNNSSLRKFDIAMKHLVKERRSFLSLEMRNTEDEKMKEYDREEFMNQLNAMLDPTAVVAVTDLPTEFIHHLSEVLQLERMPFVAELSESQNIDLDNSNESETSRIHVSRDSNQDNLDTEHLAEYTESQNVHSGHREIADTVYREEKPPDFCPTTELTLNILKEDTSSSHRSLSSNINPEAESTLKKHQQPLFNEADLDDILSEVTEKTKNLPNSISSVLMPDKPTETRTSSSFTQAVITEAFEYNTFSKIPNKTAADLDDIFSAGIARVKQLGKSSTDSDNSRTRKSNSEERNTFKSERYERWNRKERDDPDTFRNLTKEEWEAKYGTTNTTIVSTVPRKSTSNSVENLTEDNNDFHGQRDCSSASPKRHVSLSPLTREAHASNLERCDLDEAEESESSSDSITSSSSESDEETVAPNVTKLLKVIKEKEKIAKKRSINETIRDEVAAEIEKKWKEKSKYKERKSRKRERRKKDKREKRRKEKKKKRWRNSHSGSSKSSEYLEGFRLLTEHEIKKEVIVKEEPASSFEEHAVVGGETENTYVASQLVNKAIDTQIQPESLQAHKDQVPTITSDMTFLQFANKTSTTSVVIQPKTKAQLKQMPELSDVEVQPATEEQITRVTKINSIINTDIETKTNAVSSTNTSVHQVNIPLNIEAPPSFVSLSVETINDNNATHTTMQPCNTSNPVAETNVSNQCIDQKTFTSSTENKSGTYKKIDIKAYKERALQRRLKEQAVLNKSSESSTSVIQDSCSSPANKTSVISTNIASEVKNEEIDETTVQLKDPRLTRLKSSSTHSLEDLSSEIIEKSKEKPSEGEQNTVRLAEFDLNTPKHPSKCVEQKTQNKSLAQETNTAQDIEKFKATEKLKLSSKERESKKPVTATEICKFKNIRSEGSKELKLKKEKIKKIVERKKKKDIKPGESKSHAEKYSSVKASEGNQESSTETSDIIPQEEINIQPVIQRNKEDEILGDINGKDAEQILEKQQIVDQDTENKDEQMSSSVENKMNNILESTSTENVSKGKTVCKVIVQMDLISFDHNKLIFNEKCRESMVPSVINSADTAKCEDSLGTEMNLEDTREANNVNLKINDATEQNEIKTISQLHESVGNTSNCDKTVQNEARSPDSPSSPFKGFIVDSVECDNDQVSQSSCLRMNCESDKENLKDNSKEWPTTSFTDKLASKSARGDKNSAKRFKKRKEENETTLISNFMEKRKDVTDEMDNSLNFTDSISISWDAENVEVAEEKNQSCCGLLEKRKTSSAALTDSHDIFNEDGEPFIVLDEYVDDMDGKSMEKLDIRDLDLEECIARDADIFADEPIQGGEYLSDITKSLNFSSMDCKKLSEVFDKNNINIDENQGNAIHTGEKLKNLSPKRNIVLRTELLASKEGIINATDVVSSTSESNIESTLESSKLTKVIASAVPEIPIESSQNIISTTSKDTSQSFISPELSSAEVAETAEENNDCISISEYNIEHTVTPPDIQEQKDSPDTSKTITTYLESEILSKLPESERSTAPQTASTLKTSTEALELHKQTISDQTSRQELNDNHFDKNVSTSSEQSVTFDKNVSFDSIPDQEVSKNIRKTIFKKSNQRKHDDPLHKVKYKHKMKHRRQKCDIAEKLLKDATISDAVKNKYPSTKEAIMARMIEIDVEIHKLMTEKMTLYQMLTNDTSTADNNLQQNTVAQQEGEIDNTVIRPQTPSLLMSQLLQNIDVSPVTTENVPSKDNSIDFVQLNNLQSESGKSVRKRKRQKSEGLVKKLRSKQDREKKRFSDVTTFESNKNNKKEATMEQESSKTSTVESQAQKRANEISTGDILTDNNALNSDKIMKTTELQTYTGEIVQVKDTELSVEMSLSKDNEVSTAISNKEIINTNSLIRSSESRTPEKALIYSDDSTWDSFLQTSSVDDQKKSNTGLALLEETYRKEMEEIRKLKAETRKRRKQRLQNILQTMHFTLTSEEEELPLSALCIKKFYQEKGVSNSSEQEAQRQESDDPRIWKNVDNVINAVAENRTEGLYTQSLGEESSDIGEDTLYDISNPEQNSESKKDRDEQTIKWPTLKNVESACTETRVSVEIPCEHKDATINNFVKDNSNVLSSKLQECEKNEHAQEDLNTDVVLKNMRDISGISRNDTSTNIETNFVEFPVKQIANKDNIEIHEQTSREESDPCHMILSLGSTQDKPNIKNSIDNLHAENIEKGKEDMKESNLQSTISTIRDIATEKSSNSLSKIPSEIAEENVDNSSKIASDRNIITSEAILKDDTKYLSTFNKQGNNVDNGAEELNCVSQNEHFIRFKEHKELYKKGETDRCSTTSSEENNNQNFADVAPFMENLETLRNEGTLDKKLSKRKRGNNKAPLRRSSRYSDEPMKRIKLEIDTSTLNLDQDLQDKNIRTHLPSTSSTSSSLCEEIEELLTTTKNRSIQKSANSRKRYTPMPPEIEIISNESNNEAPIEIKRCKQRTISEMMSCAVQLMDCRHTLLNPNVNPNLLQNYGISKININAHSNSAQIDFEQSSEQLPPTKDLSNACTKQTTSLPEFSSIQCSKLSKMKVDQTNSTKVKRVLKPANMDSCIDNKGDCTEPDVEIMPVLMKEPVTVDISHKSENPDVEIVEEKKIVTKNQQHSNSGLTLTVIDTKEDKELPRTHYTVHKGPILDIKVFKSSFLAASEDGRIYRYNQASNGILNIYKGHKAAVTCLYVCNTTSSTDISRNWMFSGSLDGTLRCYNVMTGIQVRETADIGSPIQCMDEAWGIIFVGTKSGHVSRYHMKSGVIKGDSIQFSDKSVLALKATNEGPRKVLIVASRSQPITIRDAQTGLFLRTICGQKNHTVYSLMRDNNLIYCGTSSTSIPVFDFTNGEQTIQYDAGVGIVCMRLYKQLLFAGCYDGNIYVFDTKDNRLVCSIPGPGNMLLSMEVVDNKIIAGSKDKRLQSWQMPWQARSLF